VALRKTLYLSSGTIKGYGHRPASPTPNGFYRIGGDAKAQQAISDLYWIAVAERSDFRRIVLAGSRKAFGVQPLGCCSKTDPGGFTLGIGASR